MNREVLKQALNALCLPCDRWNGTQTDIVNEAIEALKQELAKPEPEPVAYRHGFDGYGWLYTDSGDGSSWREKKPSDGEWLYVAPIEPKPTLWARIEDGALIEVSGYYTDDHPTPLYIRHTEPTEWSAA